MATLFTRIIEGEIPGTFVWKDDRCAAFLSIAPLAPGHTLVVPRDQIDHWIDAEDDLLAHLMSVARQLAGAMQAAFEPEKVGLMIAGLEVPHLHIHLVPMNGVRDLDFANANVDATPEELEDAANRIREALART
jgi:diadenosine tetraphosphate (Ap4A) HIT family hydrolase